MKENETNQPKAHLGYRVYIYPKDPRRNSFVEDSQGRWVSKIMPNVYF